MRRSARWVLPKGDDSTATRLSDELNIQRLTASILAGRGYHTPETARQFLSPSLSSLHDPLLLLDMKAAVARVALAIERQRRQLDRTRAGGEDRLLELEEDHVPVGQRHRGAVGLVEPQMAGDAPDRVAVE